jgi:drug/metabolite transporter, DME family
VFAIGSAPVFAGLLGWLMRKERPSGCWLLATLLAIAGCALLFLNQEDVVVNSLRIVYALSAGFSYSTYALFSKSLLEKHHPYAVLSGFSL